MSIDKMTSIEIKMAVQQQDVKVKLVLLNSVQPNDCPYKIDDECGNSGVCLYPEFANSCRCVESIDTSRLVDDDGHQLDVYYTAAAV